MVWAILEWTSEFLGSKIFLTTDFWSYFSRFGWKLYIVNNISVLRYAAFFRQKNVCYDVPGQGRVPYVIWGSPLTVLSCQGECETASLGQGAGALAQPTAGARGAL